MIYSCCFLQWFLAILNHPYRFPLGTFKICCFAEGPLFAFGGCHVKISVKGFVVGSYRLHLPRESQYILGLGLKGLKEVL